MLNYTIPPIPTSYQITGPQDQPGLPLGPIAENPSAPKNTLYHDRWSTLKSARRMLPKEKIAQCQNAIAPHAEYVEVRTDGKKARYRNLIMCESPSCPHCAPIRAEQDRHELSVMMAECEKRGWTVALVTGTLRHNPSDALSDLVSALKTAWDRTFSGRFYQDLKDDWGMLGKVKADETTYGKNGWHPHIHALFVFDSELTGAQVEHIRVLISEKWLKMLSKLGYNATWEHGIDVRTAKSDIAQYIAKYGREPREYDWGADSELARGNIKRSSHEGLTPFELLGAAAGLDMPSDKFALLTGQHNPLLLSARAGHLWTEFYYAMKGRARLHWGHMRKLLNLDEALAQFAEDNPVIDESESIVLLDADSWREVKRQNAEPDLLVIAASGDRDQVQRWLDEKFIAGIVIRKE